MHFLKGYGRLNPLLLAYLQCRPRNDNPYLLVGNDPTADDEVPTTELGVLDFGEEQQAHPTSANPRPSAGK